MVILTSLSIKDVGNAEVTGNILTLMMKEFVVPVMGEGELNDDY